MGGSGAPTERWCGLVPNEEGEGWVAFFPLPSAVALHNGKSEKGHALAPSCWWRCATSDVEEEEAATDDFIPHCSNDMHASSAMTVPHKS